MKEGKEKRGSGGKGKDPSIVSFLALFHVTISISEIHAHSSLVEIPSHLSGKGISFLRSKNGNFGIS